jgi:LacI family transcriptional regulator
MTPKSRHVAVMLDLEWPYKRHTALYAGTQKYGQEQGWEMIIDEYADDTLPARRGRPIPYDGVIARATAKLAQRAALLQVPVVNVWLNSPVRKLLPGVFPDFSAVGRLRAEHLLTRGLCRFACLISQTVSHDLELQAFRRTLREAGYSCTVAKVPLSPTETLARWRKTEAVISAWMNDLQPPVGVYVAHDSLGRVVVQTCRSRGLRVPEDVAVIAGLNEETICEHPRPSLTSVEAGYERIGYEAARLLHHLMDGQPPPNQPLLLPPQGLIVRESTDFLAVDDKLVATALTFIAANCHRRIGPNDVARAVGVETRTLQIRFRKVLDRPIATEIRRVRIERAKRELTQSKRALSEIARDVGFGVTMRMYEVFRRELGVTPSRYRKQRQGTGGT